MQLKPRILGALKVSANRVRIRELLDTGVVALEGEEGVEEGIRVVVAKVVDGDVDNITLINLANVGGRHERLDNQ